jgi:hypothetical protein
LRETAIIAETCAKNLYNVATSQLKFPDAGYENIRLFESRMPYKGGADKDLFSHISAIFLNPYS